MLMVGGGAVNFHGYQRHSIDVDFWIDTQKENLNKSFDQAYEEAEIAEVKGKPLLKWRVLSFDDLITGKVKSRRPKDLLDVQELQRIKSSSKSEEDNTGDDE